MSDLSCPFCKEGGFDEIGLKVQVTPVVVN